MTFSGGYVSTAASLRVRLSKSSTGITTLSDDDLGELATQATRLVKSIIRAKGTTPPAAADSDGILTQAAIEVVVAIVEGSFWIRSGDATTISRAMPLYLSQMVDGYVNSVKGNSDVFQKGEHTADNYERGL